MPIRILEIEALAAVPAVDLAGPLFGRVRPIGQLSFFDAFENRLELRLSTKKA